MNTTIEYKFQYHDTVVFIDPTFSRKPKEPEILSGVVTGVYARIQAENEYVLEYQVKVDGHMFRLPAGWVFKDESEMDKAKRDFLEEQQARANPYLGCEDCLNRISSRKENRDTIQR